jgi:hypothetical protein
VASKVELSGRCGLSLAAGMSASNSPVWSEQGVGLEFVCDRFSVERNDFFGRSGDGVCRIGTSPFSCEKHPALQTKEAGRAVLF